MSVATPISFVISFLSAILIFSALQFGKHFFLSSQFLTILAGGIGSWFFIISLTAISNLESMLLGKGFQARWLEVLLCLLGACFACSTIHRVAVTSCLLSSFVALYYMNKISQKFHTTSTANVDSLTKKKKKL